MIVCGMVAGNSVSSIIARALVGLLGGFVLGSLSGWIGVHVVCENAGAQADDAAPPPSGEATGSSPSVAGRAAEPSIPQV